MTATLGIFIFIVAFFGLRGYLKGFFGALSRTISLLTAYVLSFLLIKPAAKLLQEQTGLEGIWIYLAAGLTIFLLVSLIVTLIFAGLDKLTKNDDEQTAASKFGGLLVGVLLGSILGLMVVYGIGLVREIKNPNLIVSQTPFDQHARTIVSKMVAQVTAIVYPEASAFSESLTESPVAMSRSLQNVANNPDLKTLMSDSEYQKMLDFGEASALVNDPLFKRLINDPDVQYFLQNSELVPDGKNTDEAVAEAVIESWQGIQSVRNDARVQEILTNPDFQRKIQSGDKLALMSDPQMQELTEVFFQAIAKARAKAATEK